MDLNTISTLVQPSNPAALPEWRHGDAFLAGGTWLFSEPQPALTRLIDVGLLGWDGLEARPEGLHIGATCRIATLAAFQAPEAWRGGPLLRQCCGALLGSFKIWNMATVGGNLCMALPAGPMTALAAALDGQCTIRTAAGDTRHVPALGFVTGPQRTVLQPGELLQAIDLPDAALRRRAAFRQISLSPAGRSAALLIGTLDVTGGFALTVTAATPHPVRLAFAALPGPAALVAALDATIPPSAYFDDVHGSPDWRRHMTRVLAAQILAELAR